MKKALFICLAFAMLLFTSCKKESLQSYIVESKDKKEFSHVTIPSSILQLGSLGVSEQEKEAYKSIEKVNITGLLAKNTTPEQYETEKSKLKNILKNSDYKTLMNFKTNGNNITLYYLGETDAIDEIIAFGYGDNLGVGIARVLGNNMNPNAIMKMLDKTKLNKDAVNLNQLKSLFGEIK